MQEATDMSAFFEERRPRIIESAVRKAARSSESPADQLRTCIGSFIDELIPALKREDAPSTLPERSESGGKVGVAVHEAGDDASTIALWLGAVSDALGEEAGRENRQFRAEDYRVFNQSLDRTMADALDAYFDLERKDHAREAIERIGFLAHELRNSTHAAQLALSILKRGDVGANGRTGAILERSLKQIEILAQRALVAARLGAGAPLSPESIALGPFLRELVVGVRPERGIRVAMDVEAGLTIEADARLLDSAVSNLVQNAYKYSRAGATIILRAHGKDPVVIEVEDECGGLPAGKTSELFETFTRRTKEPSGFGLGLAIVREAALAHGGSVSVRDLPGKGCIFSIVLPRTAVAPS